MANVTIDNSVNTSTNIHHYSRALVFVTQDIGYQFYIDDLSDVKYKKTTDGGANWGAEVNVKTGTATVLAVWWGKWGNASVPDNLIHITYCDANNIYYKSLDPDDSDTLSGEVSVGALALEVNLSGIGICQNSDNKVVIFGLLYTGTFSVYKSDVPVTSFSACASASITPGNYDQASIIPHPTVAQDVIIMWIDYSATDLLYNVYDESADTWGGNTAINSSFTGSSVARSLTISSCLDTFNDRVALAVVNNATGNPAVIKFYTFNGTSWTAKTDVRSVNTMQTCSVAVDNSNGYFYVAYGLSSQIYYKLSTDGGATWGSETDITDSTGDIRHVWLSNGSGMSRVAAAWEDITPDDIIFESITVTTGVVAVPTSMTTTWDIIEAIPTSLVTTWDVLNAVETSLVTTWDIIEAIVTSLTTTWDMIGKIDTSLVTTWDVLTNVDISLVTTWDVLVNIDTSLVTTWNVVEAIPTSLVTTWDVLNNVDTSLVTTWNVLTAAETSLTTTWDIIVEFEVGNIALIVNGIYRNYVLTRNSVNIEQALNSQVDTCTFQTENYKPDEGQTVDIYFGFPLSAGVASGASVVCPLTYNLSINFNRYSTYREGDEVVVGPQTAVEEVGVISAIGNGTVTIANLVNNHAQGEMVSKKIFAGEITKIKGKHLENNTSYYVYTVECVDVTDGFNSELYSNVLIDRTVQYIVVNMLNRSVNYNHEIENFEYDTVTPLRAAWIESGDGADPNRSTSDFMEGDIAAEFPWVNSGGTATFTYAPSASDISDFIGVASGVPTNDSAFRGWFKGVTNISAIKVRIGSSASDYLELTVTPSADWQWVELPLKNGSATGTPNWEAFDYIAIVVTETGNGSLFVDGFRVNAEKYFTCNNVLADTPVFPDVRFSLKTATYVLEQLAAKVGWQWYIDYDRDIHFFEANQEVAPFNLTESSLNYGDLEIEADVSQLVNKLTVKGGSEASATQIEYREANGTDDSFFISESPRTYGYSEELDRALYDFALEIDTGAGYVAKTVGIVNADDAADYEWMLNPEEKYIKPGTAAVPSLADLLKFTYTYNKKINVSARDGASIARTKALIGGKGIKERVIEDGKILSTAQAFQYASAFLAKYANAIVNLEFQTHYEGLQVGQTIQLTNSNYGYSEERFLIQRLSMQQMPDTNNDMWTYHVQASTSYFGLIELFKMLLDEDITIDEGEEIAYIEPVDETVTLSDTGTTATLDGDLEFLYGPDSGHDAVYGLSQYS